MPWEEVTIMSQRQNFINDNEQGTLSFTALCNSYGISRKTGYKWLQRYKDAGSAGFLHRIFPLKYT
ncbi:MAG: helix-turn-helix domain-containing protein [Candidatus Electryoneaceae bacterium]|nr:helix-turn-helix domain-containing protein [Candidatus Electryoneaceae bacterium]